MLRLLNKNSILSRVFSISNEFTNVSFPKRQIFIGSTLQVPRGTDSRDVKTERNENDNITNPLSVGGKFKPFKDSDSTIIVNTLEESRSSNIYLDDYDEFEGISLKRGIRGVFDIEDLVEVLRKENVKNIFVCAVPDKYHYVEYICIVSCKSPRHILAIAEFIRKLYKKKMIKTDIIPRIEGKSSKEWMALDLGNIALHVFVQKTRDYYNLEMLWGVGPEYDPLSQQDDSIVMKYATKHTLYLQDLKPVDS